jgi:uncharacterized protein with HEPN domain
VRDDRERLKDILKAADHILAKTGGGRRTFESDEMLQVWVLHHLQIIGEAARALTQEFRQHYPDRVWAEAAGLRNILVHHYFEIDADEVWKVVESDLTPLRDRVVQILESDRP